MSSISHLIAGDYRKVKIGDVEFEIKPLNVKHIAAFDSIKDNEQMIVKMITATLQMQDADITEDEVVKIPLGYLQELMEAVIEVNGMDNKTKK